MSKKIGWIHLHRKIQECVIWDSNEKFDCRSAWIDLLLLANHEDKKIIFDGKPITVQKGQRITSIRNLADRWHWSIDKTSRYLKMLESENMITRESDNRRTLLTIVNYSLYNDVPNTDEDTDKDTDKDTPRTPTSTQPEHQQVTNKNNKNDKNEENDKNNNIPPTPLTGEWDEEKHTNLVNFEHLVETEMNEVKNKELINTLREWLNYKDHRKPKATNHYQLDSIRKLANKMFEYAKVYGTEVVIRVVNDTMANNYQGITWTVFDKMPKKKASNQSSLDEWAAKMKKERGET